MECTLDSDSARRGASRGELGRPWGVLAGQCMTGSRCSSSRLSPGSSRERGGGLLPGGSPSCRSLRSFSLVAPAEGGAERASRLHGLLGTVLSYRLAGFAGLLRRRLVIGVRRKDRPEDGPEYGDLLLGEWRRVGEARGQPFLSCDREFLSRRAGPGSPRM
jgi:hypothetical protein